MLLLTSLTCHPYVTIWCSNDIMLVLVGNPHTCIQMIEQKSLTQSMSACESMLKLLLWCQKFQPQVHTMTYSPLEGTGTIYITINTCKSIIWYHLQLGKIHYKSQLYPTPLGVVAVKHDISMQMRSCYAISGEKKNSFDLGSHALASMTFLCRLTPFDANF